LALATLFNLFNEHLSPSAMHSHKAETDFTFSYLLSMVGRLAKGITEFEVILVCSYRSFSPWPLKHVRFICRNVYTRFCLTPLCEDKASVEITSPYAGLLKETLVKEGQVAKVGQGLCITEVDEEVFYSSDLLISESPDASPATGALMPKEVRVFPGNQPGVSESEIASEKRPVSSSSLASTRSE
jgi:hypothetical protein